MIDSFGARLRQRREDQGIDLIAIASQTKIKASLLEGLERDDVSHWPSGIFRRAYVRAYAQAIGLDPDVVVREFVEVHAEPAEVVTTESLAAAVENGRPGGGPPTRLRYIMGSALESLTRLRRGVSTAESPAADARAADIPARSSAPAEEALKPAPAIERFDAVPAEAPSLADVAPVAEAPRYVTLEEPREEPAAAIHEERDAFEPMAAAVAPASAPSEDEHSLDIALASTLADDDLTTASFAREDTPPAATAHAHAALPDLDLLAFAQLCTEFGRVESPADVQLLLKEAASILAAPGIVVWVWDGRAGGLAPALAHGYSEKVLAHLPVLPPDADNATASAFRSAQTCVIEGSSRASGGIVVPLMSPRGCTGVLAIELPHGCEHDGQVRAVATILGAMMAQLVGAPAVPEVSVLPDIDEAEPMRLTVG